MARKKAPSKKRASKKKSSRRKKGVITVDFTGVESGGGMPTPDGYYVGEIISAEEEVSQSGHDMVTVKWKTNIGSQIFDHFSLQPQALFNLKTAMECMGYDVPDAAMDITVEDLVGEKCGLDVQNEEYEEKQRPKIVGYLPVEVAEKEMDEPAAGEKEEGGEPEDEPEEEEKPPKASKKKSKKKAKVTSLRPGARVSFEDDDGDEYEGVIEGIEDDMAVVVDDEEGEWEIPVAELKKA